MTALMLGKRLAQLNPVGRAVGVGFDLLDLWQQTQEAKEDKWLFPPEWTQLCSVNPDEIRNRMIRATNSPNLNCPIGGQVPAPGVGDITVLSQLPVGPTVRWVGLGPLTLVNPGRMRVNEQWYRPNQGPTSIPRQFPTPAVVQPMPANLRPPAPVVQGRGFPKPQPEHGDKPQPARSPATRGQQAPKPYEQDGVQTDTDVIVTPKPETETKPKTETPVRTRTLPKTGEKKWVLKDPLIAKYYGWLTEIKDALECVEKNLEIVPKGGLHERLMAAATHLALKGISPSETAGLMRCVIEENVKDYVIGKANRLANHALVRHEYYRSPVGLGRGGFSHRMR